MIRCMLLLLIRVVGRKNEETIGEFVGEEQRSLLKSFMTRLEKPLLMGNGTYEKLRESYPKEYYNSRRGDFYQLSRWMHGIHHGVKANKLRELVRIRILELDNVIRRFYSEFGGSVFHSDEDSPFYQTMFLNPLEEITNVSGWEILQDTHDKIVYRTVEVLVYRYPKDLFSDGAFVRNRTHRDVRRAIIRNAAEIMDAMVYDHRLKELLDMMVEFTIEYYERIKDTVFLA